MQDGKEGRKGGVREGKCWGKGARTDLHVSIQAQLYVFLGQEVKTSCMQRDQEQLHMSCTLIEDQLLEPAFNKKC